MKNIEKEYIDELLKKYKPVDFAYIEVNQTANRIKIKSLSIEGFAGFVGKKVFDFETKKGLIALKGCNGAGKTSLISSLEQCLCVGYSKFNVNKKANKNEITVKYNDANGEHEIVCTDGKWLLDGVANKARIISGISLDVTLAEKTTTTNKDIKEQSSKIFGLANLDEYFNMVEKRKNELETEEESLRDMETQYEKEMAAYDARVKGDSNLLDVKKDNINNHIIGIEQGLKDLDCVTPKLLELLQMFKNEFEKAIKDKFDIIVKKPERPKEYADIDKKLSELNTCKTILKEKNQIYSKINKEYMNNLVPKIKKVANLLNMNLEVDINEARQSIKYIYNGVEYSKFSSGQKVAVGIAVALAYSLIETNILFIDEKLDSLDKNNFPEVQKIIKEAMDNLEIDTFVISTHRDMPYADGVIEL